MLKHLSVQTALVALLTLGALVLLCLVVANGLWRALAPLPAAPAPAAELSMTIMQAAYTVFGTAPAAESPTTLQPAATGLALRLLGIIAAQGSGADYAVVELSPGTIMAVREGEELAPGLRLAEVGEDRLVLERSGIRETLAWPQP